MSAARDLANFLTGITVADLSPQTLDHAAMLIASTLASAAMGAGRESAAIHPRLGAVQKVLFPGYTGYRQSGARRGFPRFACYPDLSHAVHTNSRKLPSAHFFLEL